MLRDATVRCGRIQRYFREIVMRAILSFLVGLTGIVCGAGADTWPVWRGPGYNGVCEGTGFPTKWSATENVAWKVALPGGSGSTPIVWGDHIFVTSARDGKNVVICLDFAGKVRWERAIGEERKAKHRDKGSGAHPSPTTDGQRVYVYYRSGDLACLDFKGTVVWRKNLQELYGPDVLWWDLGTSPVLTEECVVVACVQDEPAYLVALDKVTGEEVWKHDRVVKAPREANQSYTTPLVISEGGNQTIYVLGGDHVTAHDAATGKELWRVGGFNPRQQQFFRSIASPVISDGMLVAPYARGTTLTGIRLGGVGDVTETHVAWVNEEISSDVPTPAAADGKVYVCTDRRKVACLDIKTGKVIWSGDVAQRAMFSASPVLVDGKIYVTSEAGTTYVLEQGDEFKLLAANELGEFTLATPVFVRKHILIRTYKNLWCIGE